MACTVLQLVWQRPWVTVHRPGDKREVVLRLLRRDELRVRVASGGAPRTPTANTTWPKLEKHSPKPREACDVLRGELAAT